MPISDSRQINKMREDAIRRSREMHSRAVQNDAPPPEITIDPSAPPKKDADIISSLLGGIHELDRLLTAALMLLLLHEGADKKLLLALGYIFL